MTPHLWSIAMPIMPAIRTRALLAALSVVSALLCAPTPSRASLCKTCVDDAVSDTASSPGIVAISRTFVLAGPGANLVFVGTDHRLRYAEQGGALDWQFEVVDGAARAGGCAMDIDESGRPVVSYHDSLGTLWFGRRNAAGWQLEPVAVLAGVNGPTSLTRVTGGVGIAFVRSLQGQLCYAEQIGNAPWSVQVVAPVGAGLAYPSLLATNGARAISYREAAAGVLRLATYLPGQPWTTELVDGNGDVGGYSSLIGDAATGAFGIAYYDFANADLRYAQRLPGGWSIELIDGTNGRVGRSCAAVLQGLSPDLAAVAYYDQLHGDLDFASRSGPLWSNPVVLDAAGDMGAVLACGVGPIASGGIVSIAYVNRPTRDLEFITVPAITVGVGPGTLAGPLHATWSRQQGVAGGRVSFTLPAAGPARLTIYDAQGRTVAHPLDRVLGAGPAEISWDGRDAGGRAVSAGVYFARLVTDAGSAALRGIVLR